MPHAGKDILIGIDAGTSVIKAVAFDLAGRQIAVASVPNTYSTGVDGAAFQSLEQTWADCASTVRGLANKVEGLAQRTAALGVTGQGDGTWLVRKDDTPAADAWLWLDARAAPTVRKLCATADDRTRFEATGTGLSACQQGAQLAHMASQNPELLEQADIALHCKDWLYLNMTGVRATDPSEASFTFGDFRTRQYDENVIAILGLTAKRHLLPEVIDGTQVSHPLSAAAAAQTGLIEGTPISLGYVDFACTALGAGIFTEGRASACSTIGSTGMHMRAMAVDDIVLNTEGTGYMVVLPIPGIVAPAQTNMAATLNLDWALRMAGDLMGEMGHTVSHAELVGRIEGWLAASRPGAILYHPYISEAGERGPFVNPDARGGFIGLNSGHRFPDLLRAVVEGLGMGTRDCYAAMGEMPAELRMTGGAARSRALRSVIAAAVGSPARVSSREEAGAAGAAMIAAVAIGVYEDVNACIAEWVTPLLGPAEAPDSALVDTYARMFPAYLNARLALEPVWNAMAERTSGAMN
jgi:erythritol kinase